MPEPVPDLVSLTTIASDKWIGLPVFHPLSHEGDRPNWLLYDVGVIVEVNPDPDFEGEVQCRFVLGDGTATLHYRPAYLWVPRVLADRLR